MYHKIARSTDRTIDRNNDRTIDRTNDDNNNCTIVRNIVRIKVRANFVRSAYNERLAKGGTP